MKKFFASLALLCGLVANVAMAEVRSVVLEAGDVLITTSSGRTYTFDDQKICRKQIRAGNEVFKLTKAPDGSVVVNGFLSAIKCLMRTGGGSSSRAGLTNTTTGESAEEVAERVYGLPPSAVTTIDPGPVVSHTGVNDTNGNGSSTDEAEAATARGVTQDKTQPSAGTPGDTTNGGNNGVSIF